MSVGPSLEEALHGGINNIADVSPFNAECGLYSCERVPSDAF